MNNFQNIPNSIRIHSVSELLSDFKTQNLYFSSKLKDDEKLAYFEGLAKSLLNSNAIYFAKFLNESCCLTVKALEKANATQVLADNEFKRYYIRGTCLQAIEEGKLLRICQIKASKVPSQDASKYVGETISPQKMLTVARICPNQVGHTNNSTMESRILRPNSSLCVEIFNSENTNNNNNKGENYELQS